MLRLQVRVLERAYGKPGAEPAAVLVDGVADDNDPAETAGQLRREGHG